MQKNGKLLSANKEVIGAHFVLPEIDSVCIFEQL